MKASAANKLILEYHAKGMTPIVIFGNVKALSQYVLNKCTLIEVEIPEPEPEEPIPPSGMDNYGSLPS